jgi:hypothetical protein
VGSIAASNRAAEGPILSDRPVPCVPLNGSRVTDLGLYLGKYDATHPDRELFCDINI